MNFSFLLLVAFVVGVATGMFSLKITEKGKEFFKGLVLKVKELLNKS